jgi:serine/threonine protein kinase
VGAGSFGRVALLVKKSPDGQTLDTLALKEADHMWVSREARKGEPNLPIEVAINRDLNTHDAVHISYLRSYKYGKSTKRGRLYLRHYQYGKYNTFPKQTLADLYFPQGDLDLLHKAYLVYGHWLPEWFIYEVLRDFCKSLKALDEAPPVDTKVKLNARRELFKTVHQDLKPENIFLDDVILKSDTHKGVPDRPMPVLADFGEADYTHPDDSKNPVSLARGGTRGYKPLVTS